MVKISSKSKSHIALSVVCILLLGALLPISQAVDIDRIESFGKGPSYTDVVPMKKVTFVNFDDESYLDDYAYLAAVPTAVFNQKDKLFSHPLLFYKDEYEYENDEERTLNSRQGIDYFMEDWLSYSHDKLDQMTLINVPLEKVDQWKANEYSTIECDNPYDIASQLALQDWSYSDEAVIAVINENIEEIEEKTSDIITDSLPSNYKIGKKNFNMELPTIGVGGNYESFTVNPPYKYIIVDMMWENPGFDPDLQLYDDEIGMVDASSMWNCFEGAGEVCSSYVYNYGNWEVGITYMPTQSLSSDIGKMEGMFENEAHKAMSLISGLLNKRKDVQKINIRFFPGEEIEIPDPTPYGCRDADFTLKWEKQNVRLGFILLDPSGMEIFSAPTDDEIVDGVKGDTTERQIHIEKLGECVGDERYSVCVFSLDDISQSVDFEIEYSWHKKVTKEEGASLSSASEGAVLASVINAPMLYCSPSEISDDTIDTLYQLGVENIHLVDIGDRLSDSIVEEIENAAEIENHFTILKDIYDRIRDETGSNDVVFTTLDSWAPWLRDKKPVYDLQENSELFIGPATYIAAHHGTPVLIVDEHPELSQAVVWHSEFWINFKRQKLPSVACMVLTGRQVYEFLNEYGFDEKGSMETMITVCDQFDIGITWDRSFVGAAIPGRFCGTPVDTAYWISRNVFYPAMIFVNPALDPKGIELIDGSRSKIQLIGGKLREPYGTDLVYTQKSGYRDFKYPVFHTYTTFRHNFNRDASKHWGCTYTCANGIIPYVTPSPHPIDEGLTDKVGAYYPDLTETENAPIYAERAGYDNVFSTNFDAITKDLNSGVIIWLIGCHGSAGGGGKLGLWNVNSPYVDEPNPWRAYERILASPRNWDELREKILGSSNPLLAKLLRIITLPIDLVFRDKGSTENPDVVVFNPQLPKLLWDLFGVDLHMETYGLRSLIPILGTRFWTYHDGIVIDPLPGGENVVINYDGYQFDDALENLHSCGITSGACYISNTYLHMALIRHGSVYQIIDPWSTSWYNSWWKQSIFRDLALGDTIGEAYEKAMAAVGVEYLVDQWWWDLNENVLYFGDPDLRIFNPGTTYSDNNYWEKEETKALQYDEELNLNGHMPFGATSHPRAKEPKTFLQKYLWLIVILAIIVILLIALALISRKKK